MFNVLFFCTGNSARSLLAECVLNRLGGGHFRAYSAGSFPKGDVHPYAMDLLRRRDFDTTELRSKLTNPIGILVNLPLASIDRLSLRRKLQDIGATKDLPHDEVQPS